MKQPLIDKILKGSFWNAVSTFGTSLIQFAISIVLARLLKPEEFGLIGMVTVFTGFFGFFMEFGFQASIIQKKDADNLDLCTAFWSMIVLSFFVYLTVFFTAPLIAAFYKEPKLALLSRVAFLTILIRPWWLIPQVIDVKRLSYDRIAKALLASTVLSSAVTVPFAYIFKNVWCLIIQSISLELFEVLAFFTLIKWKPTFTFSFKRLSALSGFCAHITFNNVIMFLSGNIDSVLIGKLLGPAALGVYSFSLRMSRYIFDKIWQISGKIFFPAFSTIQDDSTKLIKANIAVSLISGIVLVPPMIIGFIFCKELIVFLVGPKWIGAVPIIRVMMMYLLFYCLCMADEPMLFALGKILMVNISKVLASGLLLGFGYLFTKRYNLIGMAWTFAGVTSLYYLTIKAICYYHLGALNRRTTGQFLVFLIYAAALSLIGFLYQLKKTMFQSEVVAFLLLSAIILVSASALFPFLFPSMLLSMKKAVLRRN